MNLQQSAESRFDANYGFQKNVLKPIEIDDVDVFEVQKNRNT